MPLSQFTTVQFLANGKITVGGPFTLTDPEQDMRVADVHFVLVQGQNVVDGAGQAEGGPGGTDWDGETSTEAGSFQANQPVQAVGWALLTRSGATSGYQMFNWADTVELKPAA